MKKLLFLGLTFIILSSFTLSEKDKINIHNEAEDWIDDIPSGLQDRLSDAVSHAQRGFYNEINYFRNIPDTTSLQEYKVSFQDIKTGTHNDITARVYSPANKETCILIYFHGGGWSMGSIANTNKFCAALAATGDIKIYSIEYPLAPEYPYPYALNSCMDAVKTIWESLGKPLNLSLAGDGAGGNLALETFLALRKNDAPGVPINSIVTYYPLLKSSGELDSELKNKYGRNNGFDSRVWEAFVDAYKFSGDNLDSKEIPYLPNTLIISAGRDIVYGDALEFSKRNDNVKLIEFSDALHGFITDGHQPTAFRLAVSLTSSFLTGK